MLLSMDPKAPEVTRELMACSLTSYGPACTPCITLSENPSTLRHSLVDLLGGGTGSKHCGDTQTILFFDYQELRYCPHDITQNFISKRIIVCYTLAVLVICYYKA